MAMGVKGSGRPKREGTNGARLKEKEFRKTTKGPTQAKIPSSIDPPGFTLTWAQQMFVVHMAEVCNQTEAARLAGFGEGEAAIDAGAKMMAHAGVRAALSARANKAAMGVDELLARETEIARSTIEDCISFRMTPQGEEPYVDLLKVRRLNKWHLIQEVIPTQWGLRVKLHSASEARDRLMRVHGLYHLRTTVTHKIDFGQIPDTPQHQGLIKALADGEISDVEFMRSIQSLHHEPSKLTGQPPLTIDIDPESVEVSGDVG